MALALKIWKIWGMPLENSVSYGGLMGDAFGKYGKFFLQLSVIINNIGVLIVYMIIIGMT